jgi:hypothetical protein
VASKSEPSAMPLSALQGTPQQDANSFQTIRIGSLFSSSYVESYAEAWKALLPNAGKMALPVLYLQRHTLELLVKDLLLGALETRSELHALDDLFGTATSAGPPDPDDLEKAHTTHAFGELFPRLERNLAALGRPPLPEAFTKARKLLTDVDEDRPDRLRYETVFSRKQRTTERSFPTGHGGKPQKLAPCEEVGSLLNEILLSRSESLSALVEHTSPPTCELSEFYTSAWESLQEAEAAVVHCLGPLTEATRDGGINWQEASSEGLNLQEHEILKRIESRDVAPVCHETWFRERLLTILVLKNSRGEISWHDSGFFLAARRPNGTLTAGVWPSDCQSNLIYEIQEAYKRTGNDASR